MELRDLRTYIVGICCETVIKSGRQDDEVVFPNHNPDPTIFAVSYIEEPVAIKDVSNPLIFMQMLYEEHLDFGFVL